MAACSGPSRASVFFFALLSLIGRRDPLLPLVPPGARGRIWAGPWARAGAWLFVGLGLLTPVGMAVTRFVDRPVAKVIAAVVYGWMGLSILLFFLLVASEVARASVLAASALGSARSIPSGALFSRAASRAPSPSARWSSRASARRARSEGRAGEGDRPAPAAPRGARGLPHRPDLRPAHRAHPRPALACRGGRAGVNAAEPDSIVITGDFVDGSVADLARRGRAPRRAPRQARRLLRHGQPRVLLGRRRVARRAERARRPRRCATSGSASATASTASISPASTTGARAASAAATGPIWPARSPAATRSRELVLLAHQPKQIHEAEQLGVGLQLSGHTHGGQIFPLGALRAARPALRRRPGSPRRASTLREPRDGLLGPAHPRRRAARDLPHRADHRVARPPPLTPCARGPASGSWPSRRARRPSRRTPAGP